MSPGVVVINTGNVLNLVEIKQKAGQNVTNELLESLQIAVHEWNKNGKSKSESNHTTKDGALVYMSRLNDDLVHKMAEEERKNLKIGIKVFIQNDNVDHLNECLENVYKTLNIDMIESVILSYNPLQKSDVPGEVMTNGAVSDGDSGEPIDGKQCDKVMPGMKVLWTALEKYVKLGKIHQLGVADLDEACFKKLYSWSEVKPSIVHINLSVCCVVPPGLQAFCKDNDIQLLTHSDPPEIITPSCVTTVLGSKVSQIDWCVRYQVHIKCRGVLTIKGYITKVQKEM